ncbi:MAG: hypothetical protein WCG03_07315, partial [Kiritimatiellales bacterium]
AQSIHRQTSVGTHFREEPQLVDPVSKIASFGKLPVLPITRIVIRWFFPAKGQRHFSSINIMNPFFPCWFIRKIQLVIHKFKAGQP